MRGWREGMGGTPWGHCWDSMGTAWGHHGGSVGTSGRHNEDIYGDTVGMSWEHPGVVLGASWENPRDTLGTSMGHRGETLGKAWRHRGDIERAVQSCSPRLAVSHARSSRGCRVAATTLSPAPQNVQLSSLHNLNFTIMETRCQARSGAQLDSCEFKEDGVSSVLGWWVLGGDSGGEQPRVQCPHCSQLVKDCAAPVVLQGGRAVLDVTCVDSMADVSGDTTGGGPRGVWDPPELGVPFPRR